MQHLERHFVFVFQFLQPSDLLQGQALQAKGRPVPCQHLPNPLCDMLTTPQHGKGALGIVDSIQQHLLDRPLLSFHKPEQYVEIC